MLLIDTGAANVVGFTAQSVGLPVCWLAKHRSRGEVFMNRSLRPRRLSLDLRKTLFVLPNLFTLSSIFCGFYALTLASDGASASAIQTATMLIAFAVFFDIADGRVARLTKTQSDFGMQLDSLADVISFGAAPALLSYRYGLHHLGNFGMFVAFAFLGCAALRLARFNVLAMRAEGTSMKYFVGSPTPLAAGTLISVMLANNSNPLTPGGAASFAGFMLVMSYLMVSNVRYRTFKQIGNKRRAAAVVAVVLMAFSAATRAYHLGMALAMLFSSYVLLGLLEEVVFFKQRRREETPRANDPEIVEETDSEEANELAPEAE